MGELHVLVFRRSTIFIACVILTTSELDDIIIIRRHGRLLFSQQTNLCGDYSRAPSQLPFESGV